jgi:valyl-tRNA synthetase
MALPKTYDPKQAEDRLYAWWMESGFFRAEVDPDKEPFCIVIPPPNITGQLHMGHALNNTLQDILARWKRMQGYETLWLPGTDHASIATEVKIIESMAEEGLAKEDLGREGFLKRAWAWKEQYGGRIVTQLKKLGSSLDWSRERFTMDTGCSRAVTKVFVDLYNKGLIYRGDRIINWCPDCETALSDAEVEHEESAGHFWHIQYIVKDTGERLTVATTRPETMLGDTAVAVHPDDKRYAHLVGKTAVLPLLNREIPIIADEYVDMEFGTGVVKITPGHDPNDFEVGERHHLPVLRVMNDDGTINENGGPYAGMDRYVARKAVVADLEELGQLVKVENHTHSVGHCYRCHTVVEPLVSKQWFVNMETLAKPAVDVVREGRVRFVSERFEKVYYNWMENIRDWCISRQLWWGHRIPAWYCDDCTEVIVAESAPDTCPKCGGPVHQDEDVLDTWFSSALWPFSTLGWPDETEELAYFYPTSVLVTSYDIIFFWVARMIFSGLAHMGDIPFHDVLVYGLVRDEKGRKMSKSAGNGIDPLDVVDQYGADALRLSLVMGNAIENDMRFYWERTEACRNFSNKVWNASRFILMNLESYGAELPEKPALQEMDRWILSRFNRLASEVTANLDKYDLGVASEKIYDFIWSEFCDWYIEMTKPRLYGEDMADKGGALWVLVRVLDGALRLLHPYMPFLTEEVWQHLPHEGETIMLAPWPVCDESILDEKAEADMAILMGAVRRVRNVRADMDVPPGKKAEVVIVARGDAARLFGAQRDIFAKLAWAEKVSIRPDKTGIEKGAVSISMDAAQIFLPLAGLIDIEKEMERLAKEKTRLEGELKRVQGKLSNKEFVNKAPAQVVDAEREKLAKYRTTMEKVSAQIETLTSAGG